MDPILVMILWALPVVISLGGLCMTGMSYETAQSLAAKRRTKRIKLYSIASVMSLIVFLTYMYGIIWYGVGYLLIGFVWSLIHWRMLGREYLRDVESGHMTFQQAITKINPRDHTLYIVSGIFIWPIRVSEFLKRVIVYYVERFKKHCADVLLNWQLKDKNNWFFGIYDRIGITKTERVTEKLNRD